MCRWNNRVPSYFDRGLKLGRKDASVLLAIRAITRHPQQGATQPLKGRQRKGAPILLLVAQVLGAGLFQLLPTAMRGIERLESV